MRLLATKHRQFTMPQMHTRSSILSVFLLTTIGGIPAEPIELSNRRELFVDDFLIEKLNGAERRLHHPTARDVAIVHDAPWEGNICYYHTVFRDEGLYRMYYRGAHSGLRTSHPEASGHQVVCYAESKDGLNWIKPDLGLVDFGGSKENNIIWKGIGQHNFVPFKDRNPECTSEAKYKAIGHGKGGLYAFRSTDGIRWELMRDKPVITKGAFDSQNLAFYDTARGRYVDFHRGFNEGVRAIMTCTSSDFMNWTEPDWIEISDGRNEHLYTNQTTPYHRAPHIFLAFPKRFLPRRNPSGHRLPGASDIVLMSSRDGKTFDRWSEAFLRPGAQAERWVNRNNFVNWGMVETASGVPGTPDALTWYSVEGYYQGDDCQMRRYTLRQDGFVSVHAPLNGGELVTKSITFTAPTSGTPRTTYRRRMVPIRHDTNNSIRGGGSLSFESAGILRLGGTANLGKHATLAVRVRDVPAGHRRLFSTYNGSTTKPGELYFDINPGRFISKADGYSIRFNYNGVLIGAKFSDIGDWSSAKEPGVVHHVAATWEDGRVVIYFDGKQVASGGQAGMGDLKFKLGDLLFGEDYPPTSTANEPFLGDADDILVLRRALTAEQFARLADGDESVISSEDMGVRLNMEETSALEDSLPGDGRALVTGPMEDETFEVALFVNFATSAAGSLRCEIQDAAGKVIPGFSMKDCEAAVGDAIEYPIRWKGSAELKSLVGRPVRLQFELKDADLFALRFGH
ncbi:MAG: hypothetical protein CMO80_20105 [Verrucomicrobiales bacterium]|nr:hypothetical protein [Verrucomicrobiales bacterium]|tara:strand:- start:6835 stop:9051 length:2217 start_codon:yes stop_codon:yes gene_type:complete